MLLFVSVDLFKMDASSNTSEDVWPQENVTLSTAMSTTVLHIYHIFLYVMISLGVPGNLLVLIVFIKHHPSTTTDWFILFITTCDFITSLINVPVYATFMNGLWRYFGNDIICKLHMFISQSLVLSSAFLIGGLALDRYIKVCRPVTLFSKSRARNVCLLISISTTLLSIPCFIMYENRQGLCQPVVMGTGLFIYYMLVFLIFLISTGVVVFSYTKVTKETRESERRMARHICNGLKNCRIDKKTSIFKKVNKVKPYLERHLELNETSEGSADLRDQEQPVDRSDTRNDREMYGGVYPTGSKVSNTLKADNIFSSRLIRATDKVGMKNFQCTSLCSVTGYSESGPSVSCISSIACTSNVRSTSYIATDLSYQSSVRSPKQYETTFNQTSGSFVTTSEEQIYRKNQLVSLRTTKIAFIVCTLYIVTWIPPWTCFILSAIPGMKQNIIALKYMLFGRMTYLINNTTNPILYTWLNRKFREKIREILCCQYVKNKRWNSQ